jgi:hypothetical protein
MKIKKKKIEVRNRKNLAWGFYGSKLFFIPLLALANVNETLAFSKTACNCARPEVVGVIDMMRFANCNKTVIAGEITLPVYYKLYENRPAVKTFSGFACRMWKSGVKTETFWTGSTDTIFFEIPVAVSPTVRWNLIRTSYCGPNSSTQEGSSWRFE